MKLSKTAIDNVHGTVEFSDSFQKYLSCYSLVIQQKIVHSTGKIRQPQMISKSIIHSMM